MAEVAERNPPAGVDVVVPCYQYGRFLRQCVSSVLHQKQCEVRVLIIDNASTDESAEVAQQLAAADARVEVVARRRNLGQHASFNEGIDWARSKYFLILCADDLLVPGALARATSLMEERPDVHLTYGRTLRIPSDGPVPHVAQDGQEPEWRVSRGGEMLEQVCRAGGNFIHGPTAVVRTSVQKRVGYYRSTLAHTDDFELWMRFACVGDVAETHAVQGMQRIHPNSQCATMSDLGAWIENFQAGFESFFAHEGASRPDAGRLRRLARRSQAEQAYWCAFSHLSRGQASSGFGLLKLAFRLSPMTAVLPPLSYLFRRDDAFGRVLHHISAMVGWPRRQANPVPEVADAL